MILFRDFSESKNLGLHHVYLRKYNELKYKKLPIYNRSWGKPQTHLEIRIDTLELSTGVIKVETNYGNYYFPIKITLNTDVDTAKRFNIINSILLYLHSRRIKK